MVWKLCSTYLLPHTGCVRTRRRCLKTFCMLWVVLFFLFTLFSKGTFISTPVNDKVDPTCNEITKFKEKHPNASLELKGQWKFYQDANGRECLLKKYCFNYLFEHECICRHHVKSTLLVAVMSKMSNFGWRQEVRKTWGNRKLFTESELRVVFILGKENYKPELEKRLIDEAKLYNDLVITDFVEAYDNLTLKAVAGIHWATRFCDNASFFLKTDDNIFINMPGLLEKLTGMIGLKNLLTGFLYPRNTAHRWGKHIVPESMYPIKYFPPYLAGSGYIMSMDVVRKLTGKALVDGGIFMRLEDVYITGILAERADVTPTMFDKMKFSVFENRINFNENKWNDIVLFHDTIKWNQWNYAWETILRKSNRKVGTV